MHSTKAVSFVLLALSTLAVASPHAQGGKAPTTTVTVTAAPSGTQAASQCNTGPVQCCNNVQSSSNPATAALLGLLGVALQGVAVPIGLTCTPINVIGVAGNSCNAQAVCCENNSFNGLIALGCTPVNLNL